VNCTEIVGLCGFKHPPNPSGKAEIGYSVAASRRGQGIATRAVALMLQQVCDYKGVSTLMVETAEDNRASQLVLERNGFVHTGRRDDTEDGTVICWAKSIPY
jgi:RimJ/RimL family protein N-acetyltransferase